MLFFSLRWITLTSIMRKDFQKGAKFVKIILIPCIYCFVKTLNANMVGSTMV